MAGFADPATSVSGLENRSSNPKVMGGLPDKGPLPRDQDNILKKAFLGARSDQRLDGVASWPLRKNFISVAPPKVTIRVSREVPGHVADRLRAAVWRGAIHPVKTGVASVGEIDKAMWAGPGLRWAAMGPTMLLHLGAGEGGLSTSCDGLMDSFDRWWEDLGVLHLAPELTRMLVSGVVAKARGEPAANLSEHRDALVVAVQKAMAPLRKG